MPKPPSELFRLISVRRPITVISRITGTPGTATLNGVVSINLQNDFVPAADQVSPNIITAGGLSGTFSQIIVSPETPTLNWQPIYTANSFGLKAAAKTIVPQLELLLFQD